MSGPQRQGDTHDPPHEVQAPERAIFLAGRASPVAIAGYPFDVSPRFFLGRVVDLDHKGVLVGDPLGRAADDPRPQLPAGLVEGHAQEHIKAGEVLNGCSPRQPQIGSDGVTLVGQGPATRQARKGLPRWRSKEPVK